MGALVAKAYPTSMFADLADHTYVECGAGAKAWSCWGGKTGGSAIGAGSGSTLRADAIASNDERAGITCYLINGVCHQAANRILKPAGISVTKARGYSLSFALFSMYGRPNGPLGFCQAPFHQHASISGDLDACRDPGPAINLPSEEVALAQRDMPISGRILELYSRPELNEPSASSRQAFQLAQFEIFVMHRIKASSRLRDSLIDAQREFEQVRTAMEDKLDGFRVARLEFLEDFNELTKRYQKRMASLLPLDNYIQLFDLRPDEPPLVLGDPDVFRGPEPSPAQGFGMR